MLNVGNGNLLVQDDDVDIPERGIDLAFRRTYNSQSQHDYANTDGSIVSNYGNGWTNTFDAHLAYNVNGPVISVFDIDGTRYDYTNVNNAWVAPPGMQGTTLAWDGGCGYQWTKKNGTIYYFWQPSGSSAACGFPSPNAAYMGRLYQIIGRNHNNTITFTYSWTNGNASSAGNLAQITAAHSDGQQLALSFADVNGHRLLASIARPDGQVVRYAYDGNANLTDVCNVGNGNGDASPGAAAVCGDTGHQHHRYGWNANHLIAWADSPKWTMTWGGSDQNGAGGAYVAFGIDGALRATAAQYVGYVNFVPNDGSNSWLQPTATTNPNVVYRNMAFSYASDNTLFTDTDGHSTQWYHDNSSRVTSTREYAGSTENIWLVTTSSWDTSNNIVATTDARSNMTNYGYDSNGNTLWVQQPWVQTNWGRIRPVARYSYDQFNNLLSFCDPVYVGQTGATTCPSTGSIAYNRYAYPAAEPFGELTDTFTPLGYHRWYSYNVTAQGGQDFGLPTDVNSDSFPQFDGTSVAPHTGFAYDAYGNITYYGGGVGNWTLAYDGLNRLVAAKDPDQVTSRTCYNADGSRYATQTAYQYTLDGNITCGTHSVMYTYDDDANLISETHHYAQTAANGVPSGMTQKWYDGDDRLVETKLPQDSHDTLSYAWMTRYIYDLTGGGNQSYLGVSFAAHGSLAKTQEYTGSAGVSPSWLDVRATAFDALWRPVAKLSNLIGNTSAAVQQQFRYDESAQYGFNTSRLSAVGETTNISYDEVGRTASIGFNGGVATPSRTYVYDADGRAVNVTSSTYGTEQYAYDAEGHLQSKVEPTGNGVTQATTITYSYYPNGWRSSLSTTWQSNLQQFAYRVDGLTSAEQLNYNGQGYKLGFGYTVAGHIAQLSDPYANAAHTYSYDANGLLTSYTIPAGAYTAFAYDAEGSLLSYNAYTDAQNAPQGVNVTDSYTTRNELVGQGLVAPGGSVAINWDQFSSGSKPANGYMSSVAALSQTWDPLSKVGLTADQGGGNNATFHYDAAGRQDSASDNWAISYVSPGQTGSAVNYGSGSYTRQYDAENHLVAQQWSTWQTQSPAQHCRLYFDNNKNGNRGLYTGSASYGWGPNGHPIVVNGETLHWDGNTLLYTSNSAGVDNVKLGTDAEFVGVFNVLDREIGGGIASEHNSSGHSSWTPTNPYRQACGNGPVSNAATPGFTGNLSPPILEPRPDGISDGHNIIQGVRAYDSALATWVSPDAYAGQVHDPMSHQPFMWNNNNPIAYSDPSGYCSDPGGNGAGVCIDAFIQQNSVMGVMAGDGRGFESDGGTARVEVKIDFAKGTGSISPGTSHYTNGAVAGRPDMHDSFVKVQGNTATVHINAGVGGPMGLGGHAPTVRADFKVTLNKNGSVSMTGSHTQFPSFEAYSYRAPGLQYQYSETPRSPMGPLFLGAGEDVRVP